MANAEQLEILKQGVEIWNHWRKDHPDEKIDLSGADLHSADLCGVHLSEADLQDAYLRDAVLIRANLSRANLRKADLGGATMAEVNLRQANLWKANLWGTILTDATLQEATLQEATLVLTSLVRATITGVTLYGTARDDWKIDGILCKYVFWDKEGKERTPQNRDFRPGEFEELYKQLPTFEYVFEHGFTALDAVIMDRIVAAINAQHPEFELRLDSFHSRGQPHAKFTVLYKEHVEVAKSQVTTDYESRIAALEGKQEQMLKMFAMLVRNPQLPAPDAHLDTIRTVEEAQTLYTLWSQKIAELRRAYAIETDPAVKFKLKHQITENEADLEKIEKRLTELERQADSSNKE